MAIKLQFKSGVGAPRGPRYWSNKTNTFTSVQNSSVVCSFDRWLSIKLEEDEVFGSGYLEP